MFQKDGRKPSHSGFKWSVMSKVESLAWDPHSEHSFVVRYILNHLYDFLSGFKDLFVFICFTSFIGKS